jgi:hypothetical protein
MDKFLIAENPMRPDDSGLWIIHLLNPQAHIECLEGHIQTDKIHKNYSFINSDGVIEEWTLSAHFFFTTDFISDPEQQVAPLLDRAWRWFRSYLEFEDKNIDTNEQANDN